MKIKARRDGRWDQLPKKTIDSPVTHSVDNWETLGRTSKKTADCPWLFMVSVRVCISVLERPVSLHVCCRVPGNFLLRKVRKLKNCASMQRKQAVNWINISLRVVVTGDLRGLKAVRRGLAVTGRPHKWNHSLTCGYLNAFAT